MPKQKTVAVAMSGGIDSSVSAALLQKQGYKVIGLFMHFWSDSNRCCSLESQQDARKIAQFLDFPLYTVNFDQPFKEHVVDRFISDYKKGLTPNPCVQCNKFIKFDTLLKKAKSLGAEYLATGHYIKLKNNKLYKAKDKTKDQSYFLYNLKESQLENLIFPLGDYTKPQVRKIAKKLKLPVTTKSESQDICFIPDKQYNNFLKKHLSVKSGDIIDINSKEKIGEHEGVPLYTIGQRTPIGGSGPWFVVKQDFKKNILLVSNNKKDLLQDELTLTETNWINRQNLKFPVKCKVQIRYHYPDTPCILDKNKVTLLKPVTAPTPGQSAVFYKGKQLLGGGIIKTYDRKTT